MSSVLTLVVAEHLHAGLRVGVIGRLETQLGDSCGTQEVTEPSPALPTAATHSWPGRPLTQLAEEFAQDTHEVA